MNTAEILVWTGYACVLVSFLARSKVVYIPTGIAGLALGLAATIVAMGARP